MDLIRWLHGHGANWASSRGIGRFMAALCWAAWMTLSLASRAQHNPISAVGRLCLWQIWRRIVKQPVVIELPMGGQLVCPSWSQLGGELTAVGFHAAPETTLFLVDLLRQGDVMLDVGANIGVYAISAAVRGATVVAFEPTPRAAEALRQSVRLNRVTSMVWVHEVAVANFDGTANFSTSLDVTAHLILDPSVGRPIEVKRLDTFLQEHPVRRPITLLKVDVEGFDAEVLEGARRMLDEDQPCIIVEVWGGGIQVRAWLEERGYVVCRYRAATRTLNVVPSDFSDQADFIAVPTLALTGIKSRLAEAKRPSTRLPRVAWRPDPIIWQEVRGSSAGWLGPRI